MDLILYLMLLILGFFGLYLVACGFIMLLTGCKPEEAITKIQNLFGGEKNTPVRYCFRNDAGFMEEMWFNVRQVIGEKRFYTLMELGNTAIKFPLLALGKQSGISVIAITINCQDEQEKAVIEHVLKNVIVRYLEISGFDTRTVVRWGFRDDLQLSVLKIGYAETEAERRAMSIILRNRQQKIVEANKNIEDDTDDEELNG